jgi:hypothetical protein
VNGVCLQALSGTMATGCANLGIANIAAPSKMLGMCPISSAAEGYLYSSPQN